MIRHEVLDARKWRWGRSILDEVAREISLRGCRAIDRRTLSRAHLPYEVALVQTKTPYHDYKIHVPRAGAGTVPGGCVAHSVCRAELSRAG